MEFLLWGAEGVIVGSLLCKMSFGRDQARDVIAGLIGGLAGGFLMSISHLVVREAAVYASVAAVMSALVLTVLVGYTSGRREYTRRVK